MVGFWGELDLCRDYEMCRSEGRQVSILELRDEEGEDLAYRSCRRGGGRGSRDDGQGWAWWRREDVKINSFSCLFAAIH